MYKPRFISSFSALGIAFSGIGMPGFNTRSASANPPVGAVEPDKLYLRTGTFGTTAQASLLAPGAPAFEAGQRYVVQLDGPMTPVRRSALQQAGAILEDYLPINAYIARLDQATPNMLTALGFVQWVGAYADAWKIDPDIGQRTFSDPARQALLASGRVVLEITLFADETPENSIASLQGLQGATMHWVRNIGGRAVISATVAATDVAALSSLAGVQFVEEVGELTLRNNTNRWIVQSNVNGSFPLYDNGLHGEGQIIGILDQEIDRNHCSFRDDVDNTPGPLHRKIEVYNAAFGASFHGTHVAGICVGDSGANDSSRGIAYLSRLVYNTVPSFTESEILSRLDLHHSQGARIHTNSWGDDGTDAYNGLARGIDVFSRNDEDDLVLFAVSDGANIRNPENAKNLLAVTASQDTPNQDLYCIGGTGPTTDQRRKPEIVAPGCGTASAYAGTSCFSEFATGTSMACPAVAAGGLLVRQYYLDGYYPTGAPNPSDSLIPTGALLKATLINSTMDMTGISGYPSNLEGWGRLLLDNALYFSGDLRTLVAIDVRNAQGLSTGQSEKYFLQATRSDQPLRITLVWTDVPALTNATFAPVNNLDLRVTAPDGSVYRGNVFNAAESQTGGTFDERNNVEQVHRLTPLLGTYTIEVIGTAVNQGTQGYAVVASAAGYRVPDCNNNDIPDDQDIAGGTSSDCNANGTPDECEPDCNNNGTADACDIAAGSSKDCNANATPDECEPPPDCNLNGLPDSQDITLGTSADENDNGVPDECELTLVRFVNASATGANNGSSWQHAFTDLQAALDGAYGAGLSCDAVAQIWVAAGTYKPSQRSNPEDARTARFTLQNHVALYGGFAGYETSLEQRDCRMNLTILSGDLNGDDNPGDPFNPSLTDDNAYSVVDGSLIDASAVLDGFTITGGNGEGSMYILAGSPKVRNCTFQRNAAFSGGGMYVDFGSSPLITNCAFVENAALDENGGGGALIVLFDSAPRLVNCLFKDNEGFFGGGIRILDSDVDIINCTLAANIARAKGGGVEVSGSSIAMLRNSILWSNEAPTPPPPQTNGPQIANESGAGTTMTVRFCDVQGGQAAVNRSGGGTLDWSSSPSNGNLDVNPVFAGPEDFHLLFTSPCKDTGNNGAVPMVVLTDLDGNPRILNGVVNMGAYEGFDCNDNGREDGTDIAIGSSADSDTDGIPDECELLVSAVSRKNNPNLTAGGSCLTAPVLPGECRSEPHQFGISEVRFTFSGSAAGSPPPSMDQATCAAPQFVPYNGASVPACARGPGASVLTCTFTPVLENARTYRFNLTGGSVEIRGLVGDATDDGFVNAADRSAVVGAWTSPAHFSCPTDITNNGVTDAGDRSAVVGAWTSPANCAPSPDCGGESMMGGFAPSSPEAPVSYEETQIVVEVRPLGGGAPLATLQPDTEYEVHYAGAGHPVEGYSLWVCPLGDSGDTASGSPASMGIWSGTGLFEFVEETFIPEGFETECGLSDLAIDDIPLGLSSGGDAGYTCNIKTGAPGQLLFRFVAYFTDEPNQVTYQMNAQLLLSVESLSDTPW